MHMQDLHLLNRKNQHEKNILLYTKKKASKQKERNKT